MGFENALQAAIYTRLSGYAGMPTVYDDVPENAAYPYIAIGEDTFVPWDTDDSVGTECTITLHVWSTARGKREAKAILGLMYDALHRYNLQVEGYEMLTLEFDFADVILDADGLTRHGVARYRTFLESTA